MQLRRMRTTVYGVDRLKMNVMDFETTHPTSHDYEQKNSHVIFSRSLEILPARLYYFFFVTVFLAFLTVLTAFFTAGFLAAFLTVFLAAFFRSPSWP